MRGVSGHTGALRRVRGMRSVRGVWCVRRVRGVRPVMPVRCVKSFKVSISSICLYVLYTYSNDIPPGISYQFFMPLTPNCFGFWKKYFSVYIKGLVVKPKKLLHQNVEVFRPIRPNLSATLFLRQV